MRPHCDFCLSEQPDVELINESQLDMLHIIVPNFNSTDYTDFLLCTSCKSSITDICNFKSTCVELEDSIHNYKTSECVQVNLEKIIGLADECCKGKICRTCFEIIEDDSFIEINELQYKENCLSDLDFSLTNQPVMCLSCIEILKKYFNFLNGIQNHRKKVKSKRQSDQEKFAHCEIEKDIPEDSENENIDTKTDDALINCKIKDSSFSEILTNIKEDEIDIEEHNIEHEYSECIDLVSDSDSVPEPMVKDYQQSCSEEITNVNSVTENNNQIQNSAEKNIVTDNNDGSENNKCAVTDTNITFIKDYINKSIREYITSTNKATDSSTNAPFDDDNIDNINCNDDITDTNTNILNNNVSSTENNPDESDTNRSERSLHENNDTKNKNRKKRSALSLCSTSKTDTGLAKTTEERPKGTKRMRTRQTTITSSSENNDSDFAPDSVQDQSDSEEDYSSEYYSSDSVSKHKRTNAYNNCKLCDKRILGIARLKTHMNACRKHAPKKRAESDILTELSQLREQVKKLESIHATSVIPGAPITYRTALPFNGSQPFLNMPTNYVFFNPSSGSGPALVSQQPIPNLVLLNQPNISNPILMNQENVSNSFNMTRSNHSSDLLVNQQTVSNSIAMNQSNDSSNKLRNQQKNSHLSVTPSGNILFIEPTTSSSTKNNEINQTNSTDTSNTNKSKVVKAKNWTTYVTMKSGSSKLEKISWNSKFKSSSSLLRSLLNEGETCQAAKKIYGPSRNNISTSIDVSSDSDEENTRPNTARLNEPNDVVVEEIMVPEEALGTVGDDNNINEVDPLLLDESTNLEPIKSTKPVSSSPLKKSNVNVISVSVITRDEIEETNKISNTDSIEAGSKDKEDNSEINTVMQELEEILATSSAPNKNNTEANKNSTDLEQKNDSDDDNVDDGDMELAQSDNDNNIENPANESVENITKTIEPATKESDGVSNLQDPSSSKNPDTDKLESSSDNTIINSTEGKNGENTDSNQPSATQLNSASKTITNSVEIVSSDDEGTAVDKNKGNEQKNNYCRVGLTPPDPTMMVLPNHQHNSQELAIFKCEWCPFNTRFFHLIDIHVLTHFGMFYNENRYKCNYCPVCFPQKVMLFIHLQSVHSHYCYKVWFWCVNCASSFPKRDVARLHIRSCARKSISVKLFKSNDVVYCMICNFETTDLDKARRHSKNCNTRVVKVAKVIEID